MAAENPSESIFNKIDSLSQFGWTPFLTDIRRGDVASVQKLISEGHTTNERNIYGLSALTVSVVSNNERMVELILNAPDVDYSSTANELIDAVSLASLLGLQDILLILLDKLPHLVNNVTPFSGFTPVFFAGINRHYKTVKLLIGKGADLSVKNAAQQTLMDVAIMMSDAELVSLLMDKSGNSDIRKPRCHPRLFTPPRCLGVTGVSPISPRVVNRGGKTPRNLIFKAAQSPLSTPKIAKSSRLINSNVLPDISFDLSDDFQRNSLQSDSFCDSHSDSFTYESLTPIAQSSLAFTRSTPAKNLCINSNNSGCFTPKLLSYTQLSASPYLGRLSFSPTPDTFSVNRSYYHYSSPSPQCPPLTPLATLKFLQTPKTFQPEHKEFQECPKPKFLTPQSFKSRHSTASKSFLDTFITPLKMKAKNTFRSKLIDKLHKSDKSKENHKNLHPEQQNNVNDLESVLEYMGLQKYYTFFEINEVEPEMLSSFTDADLRSMGIKDKKVRHLILRKIQKNLCFFE